MKLSDKKKTEKMCNAFALRYASEFGLPIADKNTIKALVEYSLHLFNKMPKRVYDEQPDMKLHKSIYRGTKRDIAEAHIVFPPVDHIIKITTLRNELEEILKFDFPGRVYAIETQIKINRLRELEGIEEKHQTNSNDKARTNNS